MSFVKFIRIFRVAASSIVLNSFFSRRSLLLDRWACPTIREIGWTTTSILSENHHLSFLFQLSFFFCQVQINKLSCLPTISFHADSSGFCHFQFPAWFISKVICNWNWTCRGDDIFPLKFSFLGVCQNKRLIPSDFRWVAHIKIIIFSIHPTELKV